MCSNQTIRIKVKSYLKKYLIKLYGPEPIKFPKNHYYNRFIVLRLKKPGKYFYEKIDDPSNYIEIMLPYNNLKNVVSYNYLSHESKIELRKEFLKDFRADFSKFISDKISEGFNRSDATILLMNYYDLDDDDITFDAFYRKFSREQRKRRLINSISLF